MRGASEMTLQEDLIDILNNEIEQLRVDLNEAFIDGAADERAKTIDWLRSKQFLIPDHLGDMVADYIEAGEHLK
jgi:hypothetical protein